MILLFTLLKFKVTLNIIHNIIGYLYLNFYIVIIKLKILIKKFLSLSYLNISSDKIFLMDLISI